MTETWQNDLHRHSSQFAAVAVLVLMACLVGTVGFGLTTTASLRKGFAVVPRPPYVPALDPIRAAESGLSPATSEASQSQPNIGERALSVSRSAVQLLEGGAPIETLRIKDASLAAVVIAVRNRAWISEPRPGDFVLEVPLIFLPGTRVDITSPDVRTIELQSDPGAFLGFDRDMVTMSGVRIASEGATRSPPLSPHFRPFVEFEGSKVHLSDDRFEQLGWDWNASYGVSFMFGSTGVIRASVFDQNFIGTYIDHSHDITLIGNHFLHNDIYGLDPHSYSSGLRIHGNTAEFNAAHGIVFSNHVTASEVTNNVSSFNGENGIMMDDFSTGNQISGNLTAHNTGDGIVLSSSSNNSIENNSISFDRFGINVYGTAQSGPTVTGNTVTHDVIAAEGINLDADSNVAMDNVAERQVPPPSWHVLVNFGLWPIFLLLAFAACIIRVGERRRLPRVGTAA